MYDMKPYLETIDKVVKNGPYSDTWESLSNFKTPEWYKNAKLGIFIHWGIFSVPAFNDEWYSRKMYMQGLPEFDYHVKNYGKHSEFGYKDYIPMFKGEKFNADEWADLFKEAGAKFVVPVAEHHDGFQMYKSEISHWNAFEMGPKRDVLGELSLSCHSRGMEMGASSHRAEHWFFMGHGREFESDVHDPMERGDFYWPAMPEPEHQDLFGKPEPSEEYLQDWLVRTCEIVDRYHPKLVYFDWWIQHNSFKPYLKKFAAYYYNRAKEWGTDAMITYKHDAFMFGTAVPDVERGQFSEMKQYTWQADTAVALNSWCYTQNNKYKQSVDIICDLIDIVSKNGCLLLNVGPKPDGTIPDEDKNILKDIGRWMSINGEAVYGTKTWRKFGEGPTVVTEGGFADGIKKEFTSSDFRFTMAGENLYVTAMKCSEDGKYRIASLGEQDASKVANFHGIIRSAEVLGCDEKPKLSRTEDGLLIESSFKSDFPIVFKLKID